MRYPLAVVLAAAVIAVSGCGGGGGGGGRQGPTLKSISPFDGETDVARDSDVIFYLREMPATLSTGLFYWRNDDNDDGYIDYPDEVEGVETIYHLNDDSLRVRLETLYVMYPNTVYMVLVELDGTDRSTTFTTEPEKGTQATALGPLGVLIHDTRARFGDDILHFWSRPVPNP
jgi:hypothetical protein